MISLPDSDDVPVDLFLPPLVALLFPLLLVTYKNWLCILSSSKLFLFCFVFFSNVVGDATSRQTNAAGNAVGHAFSRRKKGLGHTVIYVSQCEMRHSNPVPQHGVFFGTLSYSFSLCSSLMFRLFATALKCSLWRGTSVLRRLFSRSLSISLSLLYMFVDLFINWVCVLSYTSSSKLFFFSQTQLAMQFPAKQTRPAAQLAIHFPAGLRVSFHIAYMEERTYVRCTVGRTEVTS